jgi:hypothetical protein
MSISHYITAIFSRKEQGPDACLPEDARLEKTVRMSFMGLP